MELKFKIIDIKLLECHFNINPEYKFVEGRVHISTSIGINYEKKNKNIGVILSVNSDNKSQPFIFNITMLGKFNFQKDLPKKELDKIANINCAAILFPYVRETIADLTRRAGFLPFHVDPLNFVNLYKMRLEKEENLKKIDKK